MSDGAPKSYILTIDTTQTERSEAVKVLDSMASIVNWKTLLRETIMIVSPLEFGPLYDEIKTAFPQKRFMLIAVAGAKKNGWLPKDSWEFMNNPKSVFDA